MTLSYYLTINIMVGAPYLQIDNLKPPDITIDKAQGRGWEWLQEIHEKFYQTCPLSA